jgi:hypothetical protein
VANNVFQFLFQFIFIQQHPVIYDLWVPQIPSVTNAIEISDMRKGTGGWVKKATGK